MTFILKYKSLSIYLLLVNKKQNQSQSLNRKNQNINMNSPLTEVHNNKNSIQNLTQQLKQSVLTPIYSPRTTYSKFLTQIDDLTVNMVINIDKYILHLFKQEFFQNQNSLGLTQFLICGNKFLKNWQVSLHDRQQKLLCCLSNLFNQIDVMNKGLIKWQQFNSKLIQTSLNLKSLSNNIGIQAPTFKQLKHKQHNQKFDKPISKMIYLNSKEKVAMFRQQSITIQLFSTDDTIPQNGKQSLKPILLPQQLIKVQTMIKTKKKQKHRKSLSNQKLKIYQNKTQNVKKDMVVSNFKNIVLDMIYLSDKKYNMLLVSCSDKIIRGWNVSSNIPVAATQPENEDELMIHQFPVQIYTMAWDDINEVLYCSGKNMKIYEWVIKTDSERQLYDPKGHTQMISSMLMLPKLQFLATGGYDGKMILWDTVNHQIKCQYIEHTRSISNITFHQKLILLFTSSYDHSICIWNPYISSLIHKIDNTSPIIMTAIIPNTNFLIYLDMSKNVKIRQINRFTLVGSFALMTSAQKEHNIQQTNNNQQVNSLVLAGFNDDHDQNNVQNQLKNQFTEKQQQKKSIKLYIGGHQLYSYSYQQIDRNIFHQFLPKIIKYNPEKFQMYVPIKNNIVVWDLLTGSICNILYEMTKNQSEITSFDIIVSNETSKSNFMFVGDSLGKIYQRRLSNGLLIKTLYQHKSKQSISRLNVFRGGIYNSFTVFGMNQENDLMIFARDTSLQVVHLRTINLKKDFQLSGNINTLCFQQKRNNLIFGTTANQLVILDVQKTKLILKMTLDLGKGNQINNLHFFQQTPQVLIFSKLSEVIGLYLPPHNQKFKQSICLKLDRQFQTKILMSQISEVHKKLFCFAEDNYLYCFQMDSRIGTNQGIQNKKNKSHSYQSKNQNEQLKIIWRNSFNQKDQAKSITLIQNDQIIIIITQSSKIIFVSAQNGQIICHIDSKTIKHRLEKNKSEQPIFYYKPQNNQIYMSKQDKFVDYQEANVLKNSEEKIKKVINPEYFIIALEKKNIQVKQKISNLEWNLCPNIAKNSRVYIEKIVRQMQKLKNFSKHRIKKESSTFEKQKITKAIQIQKKWQKDKEQNQISTKKALRDSSTNMKFTLTRGGSFNLLKGSKSIYQNEVINLHRDQTNQNLRKNPMYRLGQALKSLDIEDRKAQKFIQIAQKKTLFPKIRKQL